MIIVINVDSPQTQKTEKEEQEAKTELHIDFGKSLRLVNFEDLVNLLEKNNLFKMQYYH